LNLGHPAHGVPIHPVGVSGHGGLPVLEQVVTALGEGVEVLVEGVDEVLLA
jgi:hypothetical protein